MADIAIKKAAVMTALGNLKEYPLTGGKAVLTAVTEYIKEFPSKDKKIDALNEFIHIIRTNLVDKVSAATIKRKSEIKSSLNNLIVLLEEERGEINRQNIKDPIIISTSIALAEYAHLLEEANNYKGDDYTKLLNDLEEGLSSGNANSVGHLLDKLHMLTRPIMQKNIATRQAASEILRQYSKLPMELKKWVVYFHKINAAQDTANKEEWKDMQMEAQREADDEFAEKMKIVDMGLMKGASPNLSEHLRKALEKGKGSGQQGDTYYSGGRRRKTRRHKRKKRRKTRKYRKKKKTRRRPKKRHRRTKRR